MTIAGAVTLNGSDDRTCQNAPTAITQTADGYIWIVA
jgi:hypothetical protein